MLNRDKYQNSICLNDYLHDFVLLEETSQGFLERCTRCGQQEHFPSNVPNDVYLSYHVRSALQRDSELFEREYGKG